VPGKEVAMRGGSHHAPSRPGRPGRHSPKPAASQRERGDRAEAGPPAEAEALAALLAPLISAAGMDLESVRVAAAGRRRLLQVVVDADGGVGLEDIARVSREVSARLDGSGAMGNAPYTLEVSSPGVDRPLTEPRHWRRARGRLVAAPLPGSADGPFPGKTAAAGPAQTVCGRVLVASDTTVTLDIAGRPRRFAYTELGPGRVQVEFGHGDSGGPARGGGTAARPEVPGKRGSPDGH
jgi:ribosome maturation factor RimP